MRRFLYLFIIVGAIILVVLIGYFLRYRSTQPPTGPEPSPSGLPNTGTQSNPSPSGQSASPSPSQNPAPSFSGQKFGVIAQNQVFNYFADPQNNVLLIQPDGQIVRVLNGNASTLSSSVIANLLKAEFSYDGKKILATFGNPSSPQASLFDVDTKSWQPLAPGITSFSWSPVNYQVAYAMPKNGSVVLFSLDVSNPKAQPVSLLTINFQDITINWISTNQMIISSRETALYASPIWSFDPQKKSFVRLAMGLGADSVWNGIANEGLVFIANQSYRGGKLSLIDTAGNTLSSLNFLTLPEKCVLNAIPQTATTSPQVASSTKAASSTRSKTTSVALAPPVPPPLKYLYCGIPRDAQRMNISQLPDDYQMSALYTADDFYRTDLSTGDLVPVFADQSQTLDGTNLKVLNQTLFFVNRLDQKLYAVSLK